MENKKIQFEKFLQSCVKGDLVNTVAYGRAGNNIRESNDESLRTASIYGHLEIIKYLLNKGCSLKKIPSIFIDVSSSGKINVLEFFHQNKLLEFKNYEECVKASIKNSHLNVFKFWINKIQSVPNINKEELLNESLKLASEIGNLKIAEYILKDCNINNENYLLAKEKSSQKLINSI